MPIIFKQKVTITLRVTSKQYFNTTYDNLDIVWLLLLYGQTILLNEFLYAYLRAYGVIQSRVFGVRQEI